MTENIAWSAVVLAGLTAIGTAYNTLQTRLAKRDQLEYDSRFSELNAALKSCGDRHDEVAARLEECQREHKASEQDRSRLWAHVQRLQDFVKSPEVKHEAGIPNVAS